MMSGLEINTTFVSYIKNKYVSDRYEPEELYAKHIKDSLQYRPQ